MERLKLDQSRNTKASSQLLRDFDLVDCHPSETFEALTRLSARLFDVPVSLISIVQEDEDRQYFAGACGLPEPWASRRQTPLSHSFCQHVKSSGQPLIVEDARSHPLLQHNLAISDLGVIAYLGVPITEPGGKPIGALCVIDGEPRIWTDEDVAKLKDLARCVQQEISLRDAAFRSRAAHQKAERYNALRESIALAFMAPDLSAEDRFTELLRAGCEGLCMDAAQITKIDCDTVQLLFGHGIAPEFLGRDFKLTGSLTGLIATGQQQIYIHDFDASTVQQRQTLEGRTPSRYGGAPLIFDGVLYGTLEFFADRSNSEPWGEEELSMLSIIAMFACAHLGLFGQIKALQNSEAALLQYLLDSKNGTHSAVS